MDRIGHYLADVCREIREQAGANRSVIAAQFNASEWTVRRFEMQEGKWSAQTDELVAAYAQVAGVEPADLWQRAIDSWRAAQPQVQPERPPRTEERKSAERRTNRIARTKVRSGSKGSLEPVDQRRQQKKK